MIKNKYVDDLFSLTGNGLKSGLMHIKKYLKGQGNPHETLQVFHIAGTNGKGSTAQMLSQVLYKQFEKKVGLFISPHLVDITERIQIDGVPISRNRLNKLIGAIYEETKDFFAFSYFEILTLVAIRYFLEEGVDYAVFETGLGGTLDSTNIWSSPVATFITSIGMDHARLLGPSLSQIQWNKMGIMKAGVPCYTPVDNGLMREGARRKGAKLCIVKDGNIEKWKHGKSSKIGSIETNLLGEHQIQNASLVYASLLDLGYDAKKIRDGLMQVEHPGRLQYLRPNVLIDGAHNHAGIEALNIYIDSTRHKWKKIITVFGCSKTKEEIAVFADTLIEGHEHWLVQPSVFRGLDPDEYKELLTLDNLHIQKNTAKVLESIMAGLENDTLVVIYGSLYLLGEVLSFVNKENTS